MKKSIIIFGTSLVILSVLYFGITFFNSNDTNIPNSVADKTLAIEHQTNTGPIKNNIPDLYYGVDTRFAAIKKSEIAKATTIYDFLNEGEKQQIEHIYSVNIVVIKDNRQSELQAFGTQDRLTDEQLKLIRSRDYFNHFTIRTEFRGKNLETGVKEDKFFGPHITVVPETQATYVNGKDALLTYLKDNSKDAMSIIENDKLGAIKLSFIVTKDGKVSEVNHDAMTTGYPSIDKKLIELLKNIPGKWTPAKNADGNNMEQELVFTFGPRDGC